MLNPSLVERDAEDKPTAVIPESVDAPVDQAIAPLIDTLNNHSLRTRYSCSGIIENHYPLDQTPPVTYAATAGKITLNEEELQELRQTLMRQDIRAEVVKPYVSLEAVFHRTNGDGMVLTDEVAFATLLAMVQDTPWTLTVYLPRGMLDAKHQQALEEPSDRIEDVFDSQTTAQIRDAFEVYEDVPVGTVDRKTPSYTLRLSTEHLRAASTIENHDEIAEEAIQNLRRHVKETMGR